MPIAGRGFQSLLAFDPGSRCLVTGDAESKALLWDVDSHAARLRPLPLGSDGRCLDFSTDKNLLLGFAEDAFDHPFVDGNGRTASVVSCKQLELFSLCFAHSWARAAGLDGLQGLPATTQLLHD